MIRLLEHRTKAWLRGATLVPPLVCAQIILSLIGLTGIGIKLSELILSTGAGQWRFLASLLAMLVSIVLGMGMPTPRPICSRPPSAHRR